MVKKTTAEKKELTAEKRKVFGRKLKTLRREDILPANIYGKKVKSLAVQLGLKDFLPIYQLAGETGLVELKVKGEQKIRPVLIHNVQLHPVTDQPLHADFYQVDLKEKAKILGLTEDIIIVGADKSHHEILAKIDTGADSSSIDEALAEECGLLKKDNIVFQKGYRSSLGRHRHRYIISLTYYLKGKKIETFVSVADRSKLRNKFLIGKRDLRGFVIRP